MRSPRISGARAFPITSQRFTYGRSYTDPTFPVGNLVTPDGKLDTSIMLPPLNIAGDPPAGIHAAGFRLEDAPRESRTLFSHADAEARFGASVFWVREGMLHSELMRAFLETWQTKRDRSKRGILEVRP